MPHPECKSLPVKPDRTCSWAEKNAGKEGAVDYNKKRLTEIGQATVMDCSKR
jgi:hypothetical protein